MRCTDNDSQTSQRDSRLARYNSLSLSRYSPNTASMSQCGTHTHGNTGCICQISTWVVIECGHRCAESQLATAQAELTVSSVLKMTNHLDHVSRNAGQQKPSMCLSKTFFCFQHTNAISALDVLLH